MPRNVVLCCDGTANEFAQDKTNVVKLFYTLVQDRRQIAYYHPGVGTMEPAGAMSPLRRRFYKLLGTAFGYGLTGDVAAAYTFLMNHFEHGDRVFLFGFSRGAYTVRAVAALLHMYGLIRRGNEALVPYAIELLVGIDRGNRKNKAAPALFRLAHEFKRTFSGIACKPWFVGIWDTVDSVGWIEHPLRLPYTADNPDIEYGRHAVSIDERRAFYRANLWHRRQPPQGGPRDLKQVWFPGVHCDIGGGYPERESALSKIPLRWMLREAARAGLRLDRARVAEVLGRSGTEYVPPDPTAPMHHSLQGLWWLAEIIPKRHYDWTTGTERRRLNLGRRRTVPVDALVHVSALQRGPEYRAALPPRVDYVN
ncbi:MAG: DUF2235 domain-containing protein [Alphaproteobacteria bacterium]|nr:DUF2235 domain-containing protein [Alphaproteobacteria bacterium]